MNEFREPLTRDIPALRQLWKKAFAESDAFVDLFFSRAYSPDCCRVAVVDDRLAGMLYWFDCATRDCRIAYLYAVATDPEFRGRGVASKLMEDTHEHLKSEGYHAAVLVPVTADLFPFYARLGYRTGGRVLERTVKAGAAVQVNQIGVDEFAELRRQYLPQNGIRQEGANLALLSGYTEFYAGTDFLAVMAWEPKPVCLELLGKQAGGIGREFQNGRTTYAPMRDEQWSVGMQFAPRDAHRGVFHHNAHQCFQSRTIYVKGIERGTGLLHLVPQVGEPVVAFGMGRSAACDGYHIKRVCPQLRVGEFYAQQFLLRATHGIHGMARLDFHTGGRGFSS